MIGYLEQSDPMDLLESHDALYKGFNGEMVDDNSVYSVRYLEAFMKLRLVEIFIKHCMHH
ncbi:hypothetical protein EON65_47305 [archaeon]|nr:MAG: hypothetical protein EON65_47305 [archaeon]